MSLPRVCYLGAYDPAYPRNLVLRRGLVLQGVRVVECNASRKLNTRARMQVLARQFRALADQCDLILLAEGGQALAPLAWWLARRWRKRLVIDAFTSIYDSAVHDRETIGPRSPAALRYWLFDWLSLRLADLVITDTRQHREYFAHTFATRLAKIGVIPVGASREWFEMPHAPHEYTGVLVQFYGTYIPLHGIEVILRAANALRERDDLHFELIGRGQTYNAMRELAAELALPNIVFREPVPPDELPAFVARADLCLGIFGKSDKATRVVPNKVYQALALGKPVITANTPAIRDAFTPGEHLLAIPPGNPEALAQAIITLASDPARRAKLAAIGRFRTQAEFSEAALGLRLLNLIA